MTSEECSDGGCCVFPIIVALVGGAFLRQMFIWMRTSQPWMPPYTVALFALGFFVALIAPYAHDSMGMYMECMNFTPKVLMHIMLPLLVFEATFCGETQSFKRSLNRVLMLAVINFSLMMSLTALIVRLVYDESWDWFVALMFGAVVCATDSLAVDEIVRVSGVSPDMESLLHGEAVLGSAVAVDMFRLFSLLASDSKYASGGFIAGFIIETLFALLVGLVSGMLAVNWLSRIFNQPVLEITIVFSVVHVSYFTVELLSMPGMLTVTVFGLYISSCRTCISGSVESELRKFIRIITEIFNSVVFLFAGTEAARFQGESPMSTRHDFLIFLSLLIFRGLSLFFLSPMLRKLGYGMSWEHTLVVWMGALNGSFNLLLGSSAVLGHKPGVDNGRKFFSHVTTVVMLKQVFNTGITRTLLKVFGTRTMPRFKRTTLRNVFRVLKDTREKSINALKSDRFMADADFDIVEMYTQLGSMRSNLLPSRRARFHTKHKVSLVTSLSETSATQQGIQDYEAILLLMNALKKTYTRAFDRGMVSKEALYQLQQSIDDCADDKLWYRYIDIKEVKRSSQVSPYLMKFFPGSLSHLVDSACTFVSGRLTTGWMETSCASSNNGYLMYRKQQIKEKLVELEADARSVTDRWGYFQRQLLPKALVYGFHLIDAIMVPVAVTMELVSVQWSVFTAVNIYNFIVVALYGMITLGEIMVMRLRFFKVVWHVIDLLIVVVGMLDIFVLHAVPVKETPDGGTVIGQKFIRVCFILSRLVRLLSLVEISPFVLKKLLRMVEKRISRRLGLGFEICCAFVRGQVEVARQIHNIIISNRQQLTQQSHKYKLVIIRTIGILQLEHPNIALSVKTKLALLNVLSAQHEGVEQLKAEGVLSVSDCELLIKRLEETVKKLSTRPPRVEDNTVDNIISNISWVHGDSELFHYLKDGREDLRLRANSILIDENTHNHDIYVIQSGVIRLETSEMQRRCPIDFLTAGNIIGEINFLTKQPNRKLARCETALTAIVFREEMLKTALKIDWGLDLPPLLYRMWLTLAKRVAVTVFMKEPHFERMSKERILAHLADAYIVDASESNIIDINQGIQDIVLVHGHAIDNITRQPMKGPCYVPTTTVQLKLQPEKGLYTLVLLVPQGNPPLLTYALEPTGQRIRLDSNALMTSTSMEGLDLKQFEITNVRDSIDQRQSFDINNDEFGISKSENEASSDQLLEDEHVVASSSADDLNISITDRSGRFSRKDTAATRNEEMSRSMESSRDPTRPSLQSTMSEDTPHSRSLQDSVNKEEGETKPAVKSDSK